MGQKMQDVDLTKQINWLLHDHIKAGGISVAISSTTKGPYYFKAGLADIENNKPVNDNHLFGIGSITKVFVAVVILQLVEEGTLALQDKVGQHVPNHKYRDIDNAESATIEQLLSHTAGIDSWEDDPVWLVDGRGANVTGDPEHLWPTTKTLDYIRRPRRTAPQPGKWYYSNTNYTLLGLIIEMVTNRVARDEIWRRIFKPLDMKHTFLDGFEYKPLGKVASRYHYASEKFRETAGVSPAFRSVNDDVIDVTGSNLSVSWMAGGYISHPADLIKFAQALRSGTLLKQSSWEMMQSWRLTTIPNHEMGYGLFRKEIPGKGTWLGHSGGVLGFSAQLWWREDGDCVVCVLANLGTVNAGPVSFGTTPIIGASDFLNLALKLVE